MVCHSNGWDINPSSNCLSSLVWKNIIDLFPIVAPHLRFIVGDDKSIWF